MEDYVYIIDHLPEGRADLPHHRREPVAYGVGENQFTLLELIPKQGVNLLSGDRVYIGKDLSLRENVEKVKGRVNYEDMSSSAHGELPYVLADIVKQNEARFVKFYNEAPAISTRFHALELLPGLGKKTMTALIDERRKKLFESFADISARVPSVHHPEKLIANRIELELTDPKQKYHIFARPPLTEDARGGPHGRGPGGHGPRPHHRR
jgi:putative nucleotide binding protein